MHEAGARCTQRSWTVNLHTVVLVWGGVGDVGETNETTLYRGSYVYYQIFIYIFRCYNKFVRRLFYQFIDVSIQLNMNNKNQLENIKRIQHNLFTNFMDMKPLLLTVTIYHVHI